MSYSKIVLGSAQFGMDYGVTNKYGRSSFESVKAIVELAINNDIPIIDTAPAYGDAESRIGAILESFPRDSIGICSKLPSLNGVSRDYIEATMRAAVVSSLKDLRISKLEMLLFHDFDDALRFDGYALDILTTIALEGVCSSIGVSVYSPDQAIMAMSDERITNIQIPFNYLDKRWLSEEFLVALAARPDVAIHARSIFLQGLLLNHHDHWPSWYSDGAKTCREIDGLVKQFGRVDRMDLCLAYASSFPWIKYIVVGAVNPNQFKKILKRSECKRLTQVQVDYLKSVIQNIPERLINPSRW